MFIFWHSPGGASVLRLDLESGQQHTGVRMDRPTAMFGQEMVHIALFETNLRLLRSTFNGENFIMQVVWVSLQQFWCNSL